MAFPTSPSSIRALQADSERLALRNQEICRGAAACCPFGQPWRATTRGSPVGPSSTSTSCTSRISRPGMRINQRSSQPLVDFRRNQLDFRAPTTISGVAVEGVDVDQTSKTEAKRHTKQDRTRRTAKPVKAREEAQKPIDPERLSKAIQYLRNERRR
jgi:hypothetical protein